MDICFPVWGRSKLSPLIKGARLKDIVRLCPSIKELLRLYIIQEFTLTPNALDVHYKSNRWIFESPLAGNGYCHYSTNQPYGVQTLQGVERIVPKHLIRNSSASATTSRSVPSTLLVSRRVDLANLSAKTNPQNLLAVVFWAANDNATHSNAVSDWTLLMHSPYLHSFASSLLGDSPNLISACLATKPALSKQLIDILASSRIAPDGQLLDAIMEAPFQKSLSQKRFSITSPIHELKKWRKCLAESLSLAKDLPGKGYHPRYLPMSYTPVCFSARRIPQIYLTFTASEFKSG